MLNALPLGFSIGSKIINHNKIDDSNIHINWNDLIIMAIYNRSSSLWTLFNVLQTSTSYRFGIVHFMQNKLLRCSISLYSSFHTRMPLNWRVLRNFYLCLRSCLTLTITSSMEIEYIAIIYFHNTPDWVWYWLSCSRSLKHIAKSFLVARIDLLIAAILVT